MNNKKMLSAVVLSLIMGNAYASLNTPLGSGTIDGTVNKVASVSLVPMMSLSYLYDINCNVTDPTGGKLPAVVKFDMPAPMSGMPAKVYLDSQPLYTGQAKLNDNNEHQFSSFGVYGSSLQAGSALTLSWVGGDDVATPISYSCYFTPSVGRKK